MPTVKTLDRPNFSIGDVIYTDAEIWDWLITVNYWSAENPLKTSLGIRQQTGWKGSNQSYGQEVYSMVGAYYQPRIGPINSQTGFTVPDGAYIYASLKGQFTGYGVSEDYFGATHARGQKHLFMRVSGTSLSLEGKIDPGFSIAKDFLPGAALVIAIAVTANTVGAVLSSPTIAPATIAPAEWATATAGMGEGMGTAVFTAPAVPVAAVAPTEWAVATAGMGEGMGTAGGGILETVMQAGGSAVKSVENLAKAVVATRVAANTIQDAFNGVKPADNTPAPGQGTETPGQTNTLMYAAGLLALLTFI